MKRLLLAPIFFLIVGCGVNYEKCESMSRMASKGLLAYKQDLDQAVAIANQNRIKRNLPCRDLMDTSVDLWNRCVEDIANNQKPLLTNKDLNNLFLEIGINKGFVSDLMVVEQYPYDLIQKAKIKLQEVNKIKKQIRRAKCPF